MSKPRSKQKQEETKKATATTRTEKYTKKTVRKKVEVTYEQPDAHAIEVFQKYQFLSNPAPDQSKTGANLRLYIQTAQEYLHQFKPARDSEFSEYDDLDLTNLRNQRLADIRPLKDRGLEHLKYYLINGKYGPKRVAQGYKKGKLGDVLDIDDDEALLQYFLKQSGDKAKFAEMLREKQSKLLELE